MQESHSIAHSKLEKQKTRLKEDAELEINIQKLNLKVVDAEPITKTITCQGEYSDYILGKKVFSKQGWILELAKG